jgi:siroheme synthase
VGKGKGFGADQRGINAVLVERALQGRRVVRLKGGDPFVFGRGGEEVDACGAAGVPVEVIPGISSALAAPALAGIPVTDRRHAASFTVLTGHRAADLPEPEALASMGDTLVVLMAATTAAEVCGRLLASGRPDIEPVAFVHAAGTADQQTFTTTLAQAATNGCPFPSPTVLVVGTVVECAPTRRPRPAVDPAFEPAPSSAPEAAFEPVLGSDDLEKHLSARL